MARDYVGLVFCDTRRARGWEKVFARAGISTRVLETIGDESEAGAFKVSVPRRDLPAANDLVTRVTRGELTLPGSGVSPTMIIALLVIAAMVVALVR
jgi:hypothetical protein